jgi:hypothetical protein
MMKSKEESLPNSIFICKETQAEKEQREANDKYLLHEKKV